MEDADRMTRVLEATNIRLKRGAREIRVRKGRLPLVGKIATLNRVHESVSRLKFLLCGTIANRATFSTNKKAGSECRFFCFLPEFVLCPSANRA